MDKMGLSRRTFLKFTGAATVVAGMPLTAKGAKYERDNNQKEEWDERRAE